MLRDYITNPPERGTRALERLIVSFGETMGVLGTLFQFAQHIDDARRRAAEVLAKGKPEDSDEQKRWKEIQTEKQGPARTRLSEMAEYNNTVTYQSVYNAFNTFLTDLMKEIFKSNKGILKTKNSVTYREIIQFSRMHDLIDYMIEKRIMELSFQSIEDFNKDIKEKIGFEILTHSNSIRTVFRIAERRNIITHGGGIVTLRYIEKTGDNRRKVGEKVFVHNAFDVMLYLLGLAVDIDVRARTKFRLRSRKFKEA